MISRFTKNRLWANWNSDTSAIGFTAIDYLAIYNVLSYSMRIYANLASTVEHLKICKDEISMAQSSLQIVHDDLQAAGKPTIRMLNYGVIDQAAQKCLKELDQRLNSVLG